MSTVTCPACGGAPPPESLHEPVCATCRGQREIAVAKCKSCRAEIRWIKTQRGESMPVDLDPERTREKLDGGCPRAVQTDGELVVRIFPSWRAYGMLDDGFVLHTCHFDTCPSAEKHRRPERKPEPVKAPELEEHTQLPIGGLE